MRWREGRRSTNIEDRRGMRPGGPLMIGGGGLGLLVVLLLGYCMGVDPSALIDATGAGGASYVEEGGAPPPPGQDEATDFVGAVLADTEDSWGAIFAERGARYAPPVLVLFEGAVRSACGSASSAVGPFYCPADRKVYLDTAFFGELSQRFGAPGDFAAAYVIAHEVGHHVQNLAGISDKVHALRERSGEAASNELSVRLELQADCFAGVWAHHAQRTRNLLEAGDLEEGLRAASAIGDDRLQREARGYVVPDSFTHGSSEQRVAWFRRGIADGTLEACDTFSAAAP